MKDQSVCWGKVDVEAGWTHKGEPREKAEGSIDVQTPSHCAKHSSALKPP